METPPAGWYPYGTHKGWDPPVMLEFSVAKNSRGRPLWERPMEVCMEEICGTPKLQVEAGVSLCLMFCQPAVRRFCHRWRQLEVERQNSYADRRRVLDEEAAAVAEQAAGWTAPPDRMSFRGSSVRITGGGLPGQGKDA